MLTIFSATLPMGNLPVHDFPVGMTTRSWSAEALTILSAALPRTTRVPFLSPHGIVSVILQHRGDGQSSHSENSLAIPFLATDQQGTPPISTATLMASRISSFEAP